MQADFVPLMVTLVAFDVVVPTTASVPPFVLPVNSFSELTPFRKENSSAYCAWSAVGKIRRSAEKAFQTAEYTEYTDPDSFRASKLHPANIVKHNPAQAFLRPFWRLTLGRRDSILWPHL